MPVLLQRRLLYIPHIPLVVMPDLTPIDYWNSETKVEGLLFIICAALYQVFMFTTPITLPSCEVVCILPISQLRKARPRFIKGVAKVTRVINSA